MIGATWKNSEILKTSLDCLGYGLLLFVALRTRSRVARLSDSDLSKFLSMSVIKGGLIVGLGQLLFLAFSSVQCLNEATIEGLGWTECKRSLFSQTGLGGLIALYRIIEIVSGIAPKKYIDRHIIKPKKIATMDLNLEEVRCYAKATLQYLGD